jgi:hypothetical protein
MKEMKKEKKWLLFTILTNHHEENCIFKDTFVDYQWKNSKIYLKTQNACIVMIDFLTNEAFPPVPVQEFARDVIIQIRMLWCIFNT